MRYRTLTGAQKPAFIPERLSGGDLDPEMDGGEVWIEALRSTDISGITDTDAMRQVITGGPRVVILSGPVIWIGSPG